MTDAGVTDASDATLGASEAGDASDANGPSTVVLGCTDGAATVTMTNGNVTVAYDLSAGIATFSYGALPKVIGFYAGVQLTSYITSKDYPTRSCAASGDRVVITNSGGGLPTMEQIFVFGGSEHFLTQVTVTGTNLSSNWMGPVVVDSSGSVDIGSDSDARVLWVPFDNDSFVNYNAAPLASATRNLLRGRRLLRQHLAQRHRRRLRRPRHLEDGHLLRVGAAGGLAAMNVLRRRDRPRPGRTTWSPTARSWGARSRRRSCSSAPGDDWRDLLEEFATTRTQRRSRSSPGTAVCRSDGTAGGR